MGQMTRRRIWPMLLVVIAAFAYDSGCQFVGARRGQQLARSRHFSVRSQSLGLRAQKDALLPMYHDSPNHNNDYRPRLSLH
eukprot:1282116-Amphidinium_carterae.1